MRTVRLLSGIVTSIDEARPGLQRLSVSTDEHEARRALCYPALTGEAQVGARVTLNVTACDLALGTGGWDFVTCVEGGQPASASGHIMKLRYTPCQVNVRAVEEPLSAWHEALAEKTSCEDLPVACCELHSQAMAVAAAAHAKAPELLLAYIMTDEAALVLPMSDIVCAACERGVIAATFTCGQATGGTFEAVSLHSALLATHAMGFDAAVVSMGPGIVGTASAFGHGGVAQGEAVNACAAVQASAIAPLRLSCADERERHRGLSHHTQIALGRVALAGATVPVPAALPAGCGLDATELEGQLEAAGLWRRHARADVAVPTSVEGLAQTLCGLPITTMGRGVAQDPAFFSATCAAGYELARASRSHREGEAPHGRP